MWLLTLLHLMTDDNPVEAMFTCFVKLKTSSQTINDYP
jgi:hypothetical protein